MLPIKWHDNVSNYFQSLQKYYPRLNPKQHTKQQPAYASIFLCNYDDLTQLQKYMSLWLENGVHKL